jgi:WD40 repeat protein
VRLSVWDLARREPVLDVRGDVAHYAQIFTPDSRLLVTGWADGSLAVHDVVARREIRRFRLGAIPHSFRFHPDGRQLAASIPGSREVQILRDIETWRLVERFSHPSYVWDVPDRRQHAVPTGHTAEVTMVEFDHTGGLLASAGWDGTTRLWEPRTGRQRLRAESRFGQFSPDDRWLGPINWGGKTALQEVAAGGSAVCSRAMWVLAKARTAPRSIRTDA